MTFTGEDWMGVPREFFTVRDWLKDARVVRFEAQPDGTVAVEERCDEYFGATLSREQVLALTDELRAMVLPPTAAVPINDVLSQWLDAGAIVRYPDGVRRMSRDDMLALAYRLMRSAS